MVNFDRFCQHSSITDADEVYNMAAVRDLSTSDAVFTSDINNKLKDFPSAVPSWGREGLHKNMVNGKWLCNPSHWFLKELRRNPIEDGAISGFSGQKSVPE